MKAAMSDTEYKILFQSKTEQAETVSFPVPVIKRFTATEIMQRLVEIEKELGKTSIELFQEYDSNDRVNTEEMEDWFDLFFLFLGTPEIKRLVGTIPKKGGTSFDFWDNDEDAKYDNM